MEQILRKGLISGLEAKGFTLDFEAKADIDGGFECFILSSKSHLAIITGESAFSRKKGGATEMVYRHFYCNLGDQEYLEDFLACIGVADNSDLLAGPYGGLFFRLISKVRQYGVMRPERFGRLLEHEAPDKIENYGVKYLREKNVISLFGADPPDMNQFPETFPRKEFAPRLIANSARPSNLHPA